MNYGWSTKTMDETPKVDERAHTIAAAIGDPGRSKMLFALLDSRARTATELAIVADLRASAASAHLARLKEERLVKVVKQGRHHYYTLYSADVSTVLEGLLALSGATMPRFVTKYPNQLRHARTCYDHIAGTLGVALLDTFVREGWLMANDSDNTESYSLSPKGLTAFSNLGIDRSELETQRRQLAVPCLDWSERRPHLRGSLAAAILTLAKKKEWVVGVIDSRALTLTAKGRREMSTIFGLKL
jgi:DNA-binding transcriptional ArsR family regulator